MSDAPSPVTPPTPPKKAKKTLTEIFNHFAAEAVERFPDLKGELLILDMSQHQAHGNADIDTKKTGLTKETALDYLSEHPVTQEMEKDPNIPGLSTHDPKNHVSVIFMNDPASRAEAKDVSEEAEEHLLFVLDHELGHCAIKNGFSSIGAPDDPYSTLLAESVADAYALIRHYQRYGVDSDSHDKYVSPAGRADNFVLGGDAGHFTSFVLEAIAERKHQIDFDKLDAKQTAELARRFALEYLPPRQVLEDIDRSFDSVRTAFEKNGSAGVKALIEKTLDPNNDYYTFKFGSLWLEGFLKDRNLPNGKPIKLPKEYLDNAVKQLKEKELKFAEEDILFNMPIVPPSPPTDSPKPPASSVIRHAPRL